MSTENGVGELLRQVFGAAEAEPLPSMFTELLDRLAAMSEAAPDAPEPGIIAQSDRDFRRELEAVIPHLRAFARSLCRDRDLTDDLVQDTLVRAWTARGRFQAGTNMKAWTFIILRNLYLSQMRRAKFKGEWSDLVADRILTTAPSQDRVIEFGDLQRALDTLPRSQREALLLVGGGGFAYEETAEICGVALGTIKSRVARGRAALEAILEHGAAPQRTGSQTKAGFETLIAEVDLLERRGLGDRQLATAVIG